MSDRHVEMERVSAVRWGLNLNGLSEYYCRAKNQRLWIRMLTIDDVAENKSRKHEASQLRAFIIYAKFKLKIPKTMPSEWRQNANAMETMERQAENEIIIVYESHWNELVIEVIHLTLFDYARNVSIDTCDASNQLTWLFYALASHCRLYCSL